ncbi:MAG: hypothetical protein KBT22_03355 [Bacteroidales bacterium]|nr:hypothetical protein [Candidatus Scybalocola fimicaballi]
MQSATLEFPHSARTVYTAIERLFSKQTGFSSVDCNDDLFVVEARHGAWISPFSENVKMKVVATGTQSSKVVVESSSRSILNLLNFGANKDNVSNLSDYINNEVYKLCQPGEIPMVNQDVDHSTIRFKSPEIKFK